MRNVALPAFSLPTKNDERTSFKNNDEDSSLISRGSATQTADPLPQAPGGRLDTFDARKARPQNTNARKSSTCRASKAPAPNPAVGKGSIRLTFDDTMHLKIQ